MKLFRCKFSWCLVMISVGLLLISQSKALAEEISASAEEGHSHDDHDHHHQQEGEEGHDHHDHHPSADDDTSTSGEVASVNQDDPHPENHDHHHHSHHLLGHGETCDAESGASCNSAAGLICVEEVGKCECDKNAGEVYSSELEKCEQAPPQVISEVHDNSLEGESGELDVDYSDNGKGEHDHEHDEGVPSPTTTTTTTEAAVKVNSVEAESSEDETLGIQNRADEEEDKSSEEKVEEGSPGKCVNVNCEETLGKYSKCDEETGECLCNDVEDLSRSLILKDGKCFINRHINDPCTSHDDCTATIAGKAWCHMDVATFSRFCQCEMWHYFDESQKECLPFASDGLFSPCKTDMQCTGFQVAITGHGLGPNARCSQAKSKCECKMGPDGQKAFLYENYCFYQMMPGEHCNINRECEVSFPGQDVACIDQQCICKNGENITAISCPMDPDDPNNILGGFRTMKGLEGSEDGSSEGGVIDNLKSAMGLDLPNFVFIMIIGAVVLLAVVIISVVIFRRRHRYSVVSREEPHTP